MGVIGLEIRERKPYLDGRAFGETGAYERIDGWVRFAVDPMHPANREIVDLELAPRDEVGQVCFGADLCLLVPADPKRGNRRLLLELPNRGRKLIPRHFNRAPTEVPPTGKILPGDGFLFRHGYMVGWIGWQWDVIRDEALMGLEAPVAMENGKPVRGTTVVRFQPNVAHHTHLLADRTHRPYPVTIVDQPDAVLRVRDFHDDEPRVIPHERWRFAREEGEKVVPSREHVYLESGFEPGKIYEVIYETDHAPVVGTGLLAVRDAASFLRYAEIAENPVARRVDHVYGWGMSQTGRMLRHFLYLGLNLDEEGRIVFDGVIPHVGGARRGEFNQRFGQPSVQATPGFGHLPPFDDAGLFRRQREVGGVPKVIQTNSSAEYWRGDCALMHIDPERMIDLPPEPDTRIYHFAGTQHGPGTVPLTRYNPNDGGRGRYGFNAVEYTPLLRAALVNLDRWVTQGIEPPPGRHPRLSDGTAVPRRVVLDAFRAFPDTRDHIPNPEHILRICHVDLGPFADRGVATQPVVEGERYPDLVSAIDADGNEVAGVRLPELTVPVGTHTGWNPRDPETGAAEQIMSMQGMTLFFRRTRSRRDAAGDPRPSLEERYESREAFLDRVRQEARQLAADRYILEEDIEIVVEDAAKRYDTALNER